MARPRLVSRPEQPVAGTVFARWAASIEERWLVYRYASGASEHYTEVDALVGARLLRCQLLWRDFADEELELLSLLLVNEGEDPRRGYFRRL